MGKDIENSQILLSGEQKISFERNINRARIAKELSELPKDFFYDLKHIQTEVGCGNVCAMCSQSVSSRVTSLTKDSMEDFFAALKHVVDTREDLKRDDNGPKLAWKRKGRVVPYLDNDSMSSNHLLDRFIEIMVNDFNCSVQLSTVGFSRHNHHLVEMHNRIANTDLLDGISELRLSWSAYPYGARNISYNDTNDYVNDTINLLKTYLPLYNEGVEDDRFRIEMRYPPDVENAEVEEGVLNGHHILRVGPHLLISNSQNNGDLKLSKYSDEGLEVDAKTLYENPQMVKTVFSEDYTIITSDQIRGMEFKEILSLIDVKDDKPELAKLTSSFEGENSYDMRTIGFSKWKNNGGEYYSIEPFRDIESQHHNNINIYPRTDKREKSGFNNATREVANLWIDYKADKFGKNRFEIPENATWGDVEEFFNLVENKLDSITKYDGMHTVHVENNELDLLKRLAQSLETAGYSAGSFFNGEFNRLNGQVSNKGYAMNSFAGMATKVDDPMTPKEERNIVSNTLNTRRADNWRVAPMPYVKRGAKNEGAYLGKKNLTGVQASSESQFSGGVVIHKLTDEDLMPMPETEMIIKGIRTTFMQRADMKNTYNLPGLEQKQSII